ncbi:hypothetical protein [Desulfospira joergensenii]|uniref:hypothetical protein n=1 Tax=Desulfospira joergensenii TaxID=53329 RepID=UPI0003B532B9|nr:hypothetical protein [Desulfospira joergensenii]
MNEKEDLPECFGNLEKVFPMTGSGLRQTPDDCFFHCSVKTRCLKRAMAGKEGARVEEEVIERSDKAGLINFYERWSRKKQVHRKRVKDED